jgi:hypothetical protein
MVNEVSGQLSDIRDAFDDAVGRFPSLKACVGISVRGERFFFASGQPTACENRHFSPPGKNISHARSGVLSDERPGE